MNKTLVIGLGTGRCGTHSFATLLNQQEKYDITHEGNRLPWRRNNVKLGMALERIVGRESNQVGDVGFWYLPYVKAIVAEYPHALFVCFKRGLDETIVSYMRKVPDANHWTIPESKCWTDSDQVKLPWSECYPKYDLPKNKALEQFWRDYYKEAEWLAGLLPGFKIFDMRKVLNTKEGQKELFKFLWIREPKYNIGIKTNEGRH